MRQWLCVSLGVWHPYKQANNVIWKHWGRRILGPYFNHLVPNANFFEKPKLVTMATFFSYIRLAYPRFQSMLIEAIKSARSKGDAVALSTLVDLRALLTFFIPVVPPCSVRIININEDQIILILMNSRCEQCSCRRVIVSFSCQMLETDKAISMAELKVCKLCSLIELVIGMETC